MPSFSSGFPPPLLSVKSHMNSCLGAAKNIHTKREESMFPPTVPATMLVTIHWCQGFSSQGPQQWLTHLCWVPGESEPSRAALLLFALHSHLPIPASPVVFLLFATNCPYLVALDKSLSSDYPMVTEMNINHLKWEDIMTLVFWRIKKEFNLSEKISDSIVGDLCVCVCVCRENLCQKEPFWK